MGTAGGDQPGGILALMRISRLRIVVVGSLFVAVGPGCRDDDQADRDDAGSGGSPDLVGSVCEGPADCYPELDHADIEGEVRCLDRVREGYCTHECVSDDDCCALEGECVTDLPQVCSPFESTGLRMCFLSCESSEVEAAGADDDQAFCQHEASPDFICRSSGGGGENRKVCVPGDCGVGASCTEDAHCDPDLECLDDLNGGYCGMRDCASNAECPQASVCVTIDDTNVCVRTCDVQSDCGFCRHPDFAATCTTDVTYVEGASVQVCVP
jgi:hypothetical protein